MGNDLFVHKAINTNTNDLSNKSMDNRISVLECGAFCGVVSAFIIGRFYNFNGFLNLLIDKDAEIHWADECLFISLKRLPCVSDKEI